MSERGKLVLIVDDDAQTLAATARVLERAGYEVITRSDQVGTSSAVVTDRPDIVLLDINMPLMTGEQIALHVRRSRPDGTIVILYSGLPEQVIRERAKRCGADGGISKGLTPAEFLVCFGRIVNAARSSLKQTTRLNGAR